MRRNVPAYILAAIFGSLLSMSGGWAIGAYATTGIEPYGAGLHVPKATAWSSTTRPLDDPWSEPTLRGRQDGDDTPRYASLD